MLKLYHHPISANSRRVWIALLEKELNFELISVQLNGDQLQAEFLALNPFHHIPVLVDGDETVIESFAILDYLEAKYPHLPLLPNEPSAIATVRMAQMITLNELIPAMNLLVFQAMGVSEPQPAQIEQSKQRIITVLKFFAEKLGDQPFLGGDRFTIADIVAGAGVYWLPQFGIPIADYPNVQQWVERLSQRSSWQTTQPSPEMIEAFKPQMKKLMAARL
jgi:glutathione S-transferase